MIELLDGTPPDHPFPDPALAESEPDGLLAVGGDLHPRRLIGAYRQGIFPWYNPGQPILWWSPDPRMVLFPGRLHVSRSLRKVLRQQRFRITFDQDFAGVIRRCAAPRPGQSGTWITPEMERAYQRLHEMGVAHSVEAWQAGELVGGLYGVTQGRVFFGESMFSFVSNASKAAFATLVECLQTLDWALIDCQVHTSHLASLGAELIPRARFLELLTDNLAPDLPFPTAPCTASA